MRLIDFLKRENITTVFTSLTSGGGATSSPEDSQMGVSSLMDAWLLLRNHEQNGERNRTLFVMKARGMGHSNQVREFVISSSGIDLMEAYLVSALTLTARLWNQDNPLEGAGETARRMERLNGLIQQHFRDQKPAQFYAVQLDISPTHLNRIVKAATGLTAHAHIGRKLIDEAKRELVFTDMPAQEIGLRLGFADPAYFSRYFLRETGETPRAWRLAERARLAAQSSE